MGSIFKNTVSLFKEMVAYETLLSRHNETMTTISNKFLEHKILPSELLEKEGDLFISDLLEKVTRYLTEVSKQCGFSVCINGDFQYPKKLRDAKHPIELFYYRGDIGLLEGRCVSIVGSRKSSDEGLLQTRNLVRGLIEKNFTIVSGLAAGVDTIAMQTAIEYGGNTIGVIGTPLDIVYPKENAKLQDVIGKKYLLISQVPFYRYKMEPFGTKKYYFPLRNATMSAVSEATVIVEASDTSGTLTQARACLEQGRHLFILKSIVENSNLKWPKKYLEQGAHVVTTLNDILKVLNP